MQHPLDALTHRGRIAIPRKVDQARHEAAVHVAPQEDAHLATLLDVHDLHRNRQDLVRIHLEELVPRVALEELQEVLAVVTLGRIARQLEHDVDLVPQERDRPDALRVGRRGEESEKASLTINLAVRVEPLNADVALVRTKVAEHQSLQQQSRDKMQFLQDARFQYELDIYLSSFHLTDAKILGVEQKHLDLLQNFEIVTAADVESKRLSSIPPIADEAKAKILEWRKELERNFEFPPETDLPEADKNRFALQFTERRSKIEKEIERLLVSLRSGSVFLQQHQKQMMLKAESLAQKLLQAESDVAAVGTITPMIAALISITALVPMFGAIFQSSSTKYQQTVNYSNSRHKRISFHYLCGFFNEERRLTFFWSLHRRNISIWSAVNDPRDLHKIQRLAQRLKECFSHLPILLLLFSS